MSATLEPHAAAAADALLALERALVETSSQWNDRTRHDFDERYAIPILASGRKTVSELSDLSGELSRAVRELNLAG